ncbi:MAG: Peptidase M3A and M3B thimet/oligopeptidase F, partial [uncultured bacterium]
MNQTHEQPLHNSTDHRKFQEFLEEFVPRVEGKSVQLNKACWLLETTGLADAADLKAALDIELKMLFNHPGTYQRLLEWDQEASDPIDKRQLNVLIRSFKQNQIPKELLAKISQKEAHLAQSYAQFRPMIDGKKVTENQIREILKKAKDPIQRKKAWEASKEVGGELAPMILELVELRNQAARALAYPDYFQMQLALQEIDSTWLLHIFDELSLKSDKAYEKLVKEIQKEQKKHFQTDELGPWSWSDPFCQEDPLNNQALDQLVQNIDIIQASETFYQKMGIDVGGILAHSDLYEREGKNQHAFCLNIDRKKDIRTLNNVQSSMKWLETVLHELGHGIYELGFDETLP